MGREVVQPQQQTVPYTVEQLVAVNPYNPDILPDLENYVNEQVLLHHHLYFFFFFLGLNIVIRVLIVWALRI